MRIRTINQCYEEIRKDDPATAVTEYAIRQMVVDGSIPSTKSGTKYLVDLDKVKRFFEGGA